MHPVTSRNLWRILEREAMTVARMTAYADQSEREGDRDAAHRFRAIAAMDLARATEILGILGWVGTWRENLLASVVGDVTSHALDYATLASEADEAGDHEAAALVRRLVADQTEAALGLLALATDDAVRAPGASAGAEDEPRMIDAGKPSVRSASAARARAA